MLGFGAGDSVSVTPKFISPIWELVSERNDCDDKHVKDTNKEKEEREEGAGKCEKEKKEEVVTKIRKGKGEGIREGRGEGKREVKVNSTHTAQSLPSASYSQSFQGF